MTALAKQPAATYLAGMSGSVRVAGFAEIAERLAIPQPLLIILGLILFLILLVFFVNYVGLPAGAGGNGYLFHH